MSGPGYVFKNSGLTPPPVEEKVQETFRASQSPPQEVHNRDINNQDLNGSHSENSSTMHESLRLQPESEIFPESIAHIGPAPAIQEQADLLKREFAPDSHELATQDHDLRGATQVHRDEGVSLGVTRDIGWHKDNAEIPDPLIGGISNGNLFAMIRRFNKDIFAVRDVSSLESRGLDLNEAWDDQYASDKITLHLQRFYLTFVLGFASLGKQVSRLRSWKEKTRTAVFCVVYFAAWIADLLVPLILCFLIIIVSSEKFRNVAFPPVPRALVDIRTGGLQKPQSGQLGTMDTLTGAPEKQVGEGVEEEAANFVDNLRHLVQKAIGMHEEQKNQGDPLEGKVPKPIRKVVQQAKGQGTSDGHAEEDGGQTQKPMEDILWSKGSPDILAPIMKNAPHVLGDIVDNWERFANTISPTPPFSQYSFLRIDAILIPLFLSSLFISSYMVHKGTGFAIGFGIFGTPILTPTLAWINRNYPNWVELLEPKNNILRGIPTNSQLTITLLRIGEAHNTPLPPVPTSNKDDFDNTKHIDVDNIPIEGSRIEKLNAVNPSETEKAHTNKEDEEDGKDQPKHKKLSKITRIFKGHTKAAVSTKLAADQALAAAGSKTAKSHLGVLPKEKNLVYAGPSDFKARYNGKKGWLYITKESTPSLSFTIHDPRSDSSHTNLDPLFTIPVKQIKELKRATAFVSKPGEMAADWSSGRELLGSVELDDAMGKTWRFTALPERDELFNRLVAIGSQRWVNL